MNYRAYEIARNEIATERDRELYNKRTEERLDNNDILMYSSHNEGKSVIAERFIKTLKAQSIKNDSYDKPILS